ncbi:uncharacterized protein LOC119882151 isoform X6 [Micropterus salmoides]|uniref:uncharacterized protein LOC119882151 isoform X6 n=1 Tax=Micropterus salmoides TaxID=27706 RepID=UPI0018EA3A29|nr:uncharacterized protein LOC119882151 isoform X6 [Micropterus salmoides]
MAEEEVNYASVVFKTKKHSPSEANKEEETVYSDVKVRSKTTEKTADTNKNQILTTRNQELETQNQDLESQRNNLTEQIQNKWNELNVSRAQWSIDAYCPKPENQNRQCKACQDGWILSESSCYGINNPDVPGQKTWEEARENCRGKISDLVVKLDQKEKVMRTLNIFMTAYMK